MPSINPIGTLTPISGFSVSAFRGSANNSKSAAVIIKGGNKQNVPTGGTADVESILRILGELYSYVEIWRVNTKNVKQVSERLSRPKPLKYLSKHHFVFIVYSGASGRFVKVLHKNGIRNIAFRAQNPEFLHRWDYFKVSKKVKFLALAFLGLRSDFQVCRYSRLVLPISNYDLTRYFYLINRLSGSRSRLFSVSYYPARSAALYSNMPNKVFMIGTSTEGTLISSVDKGLARKVLSGAISLRHISGIGYGLEKIGHLLETNLGFQKDLETVMQSAAIVVIPTTKGWGFKTKIADLICQGKEVVVHKDLAKKIDSRIIPYLTVIESWEDLPLATHNKSKESLAESNLEFMETATLSKILHELGG
jgi:hypothetical protein